MTSLSCLTFGQVKSSYQCYFDDGGKTRNAELEGKYSLLTLTQTQTSDAWKIKFKSDYMEFQLPSSIYVRLRAAQHAGSVSDSLNRVYSDRSSLTDLFDERKESPGRYYDSGKKEEWLKVPTDRIDNLTVTTKTTSAVHALA